jgi:hypothetical protein
MVIVRPSSSPVVKTAATPLPIAGQSELGPIFTRSGLGLEAQRAAVIRFAETAGLTLSAEYVEAESGKGRMLSNEGLSLDAALAGRALPSARS